MSPLTAKQAAVLKYLKDFTRKHGFQPSIREMCDYFGFGSPNAIICHLNALEAKGKLKTGRGKSRCIEIVGGI